MTVAEASLRMQMALKRKAAVRARCQAVYFGEVEELTLNRDQEFNALRDADAELERAKRAIFEAVRRL